MPRLDLALASKLDTSAELPLREVVGGKSGRVSANGGRAEAAPAALAVPVEA